MPKLPKMTKLPKIKDVSHIIEEILTSANLKANVPGFNIF